MKHFLCAVLFLGSVAFLASAPGAAAQTPTTTNVQVVRLNVQERILVIKNADGVQETVQLDDNVAGVGGIKAGDRVLMTFHGEPGMKRVSALTKTTASAVVKPALPRPAAAVVVETTSPALEAKALFADQVATLAQQARPIDALWAQFQNSCAPKVNGTYTNAREWFGFWDDAIQSDLSSGTCREMRNQIIAQGEVLKKGMAAAEDQSRKSVDPIAMREIRRLNAMDWDGWTRAAPERSEVP